MKLHNGNHDYYVDYIQYEIGKGEKKEAKRIKGLKVSFKHDKVNDAGKYSSDILSNHRSQAIVYNKYRQPVAAEYAYCSTKDTFSKQLGRTIALGRLLKMDCIEFNHVVDKETGNIIRDKNVPVNPKLMKQLKKESVPV